MPSTTYLEAINILLAAIGSSPVNSTETPQNADAIMAKNFINQALREIQSENWYFNTEDNCTLTPSLDGEIYLKNIIKIDNIGCWGQSTDLILRGSRLYDRKNHTYKIQNPVTANITYSLDYDEIPETAAQYVIARAARQYQETMLGDPHLRTWTREDEATARGKLLDEHLTITKPAFGLIPKLDPNIGLDMREC